MANIDGRTDDEELRAEIHDVSNRLAGVEKRLDVFDARLTAVETRLTAVESRLIRVETVMETFATKADLNAALVSIHQAINAQTWKIVGFGIAIAGASFALALYL